MAKQFPALDDRLIDFIGWQKIFFVASAAAEGRINVSPKGMDSFRVLSPSRACYLDLTGSGNETAAHARADGRITVMFCAFEGAPNILRLYGRGSVLRRGGADYAAILGAHFGGEETAGARQIVVIDIEMVQTSCGFAVPRFEYREDRDTLLRWAESREAGEGLDAYRRRKNATSMDGLPTGMFEEDVAAE